VGFQPQGPEAAETHIDDLPDHLGQQFGPSDWHLVSQALIDEFADVPGDRAWYHVDVERAAAELPDGKTIAHGLLTLSLVPTLLAQTFRLGFSTRGLNNGYDNLRFLAPVQAGDRLRLTVVPTEITPRSEGSMVRVKLTVEVERGQQLALVADQLLFILAEA
jgi:acyl dehydratase